VPGAGKGHQLGAGDGGGGRPTSRRVDEHIGLAVDHERRTVDPSGGRATAAAIPGAELMTLPGAGHHIPQEIFDPLADRIAAHLHPNDVRHTG
jgi:hypothetical protein